MNWTDVPDCDVPLIVITTEVWPAWEKVLANLEQIPKWEVSYSEVPPEACFSPWMEVFKSVIEIHGAYSLPQAPHLEPYIFQLVCGEDQFQRLPKRSELEFRYLESLLDHIISRFSKLLTACPVGGLQLWDYDQWRGFEPPRPRIPHTDYHQYIGSDQWREKATMAKEDAGRRCQVCNGADRLEAHHRTYERLGHEEKGDITVLCRDCHQVFHDNGRLVDA